MHRIREQVDAMLRAMFDFSDVPADLGYKICVCPRESQINPEGKIVCPDLAGFTDNNVLDVQSEISGLDGNGFSGSFVYLPKLGCQGSCPKSVAPSASYIRTDPAPLFQISIIQVTKSCTSRDENPAAAGFGPGA
jgi:hypothetical protein